MGVRSRPQSWQHLSLSPWPSWALWPPPSRPSTHPVQSSTDCSCIHTNSTAIDSTNVLMVLLPRRFVRTVSFLTDTELYITTATITGLWTVVRGSMTTLPYPALGVCMHMVFTLWERDVRLPSSSVLLV